MSAQLLERNMNIGRWLTNSTELRQLLELLETWLPLEERRLTRTRETGTPDRKGEARWSLFLALYEQLALSLLRQTPRRTGTSAQEALRRYRSL